jgi:hypothetical protein
VLWRWVFGIPALLLLYQQAVRIAASSRLDADGLFSISLNDPVEAGQQLTLTASALAPRVEHAALWIGPLLILAWAVISGMGRTAVLRRLDSALRPAPFTLILLQLLRMTVLTAVCVGWYRAIQWAAAITLDAAAPNLVAYSAWVICLSLGMFVLWALMSWVFFLAPLLAMLEGTSVLRSLTRSLRPGAVGGKLVEVNLVMGIVRLALIVLAMVFSAIPLPFEANMSGTALYVWWLAVTVWYLVASDFFQVARLAAFVQFWKLYHS